MRITVLSIVFTLILTTIGAVPQRLKPQCRSNVCDDRPQCPKSSCKCVFPSGMDCAVYYQCINGKPHQYRCSPGLLFNEDTLSCDYSYNVNCSISTTTSTTVTRPEQPTTVQPNSSETTEITEEPTTTEATENLFTTETTEEIITIKTTKEPTTTKITEEPTTTKITEGPTTAKTTEKPTTTKITETTDRTEEITTFRPTENPSTTKVTEEPLTTKTAETTSTKPTVQPITTKTTEESTTTKTVKPTTTETAAPTAIKTTEGPTTTKTVKPTTTETAAPTTIKTTEEPTTTKRTEPTSVKTTTPSTAKTTKEITTTKPTEEIITTETTVKVQTTAEITETTSPTFTPSDIQTESTTLNPSSDFVCPTRFGLFPDPESCSRFYDCSHWIPYHEWCPPDLHFNPYLKVCDWPDRAGCAISTIDDVSSPTTVTIPEEPTTTKITDEVTTTKTSTPTTTTTTKASTTQKTTEEPTTTEITDETKRDKTTEKLTTTEEPTTVKTTVPTTTKTTQEPTPTNTTELSSIKTEKPTTAITAIPTTTEITEEPTTTETTEGPTTIKTTQESRTTKITQEPSTTNATEEPTTIETGAPFTNKTEEPITTTTTEPTTVKTSEPSTTKITEPPTSNTTKELTTIGTTEEVNTTETTIKVPTTAEITVTTSPSGIPTVSTTTNPSSDFECPTRFGLFPDPKSCFRFYHCSHWIPYHKWCPSNLHFNPKLKVCDWPYRAGCDSFLPTPSEPESPVTSNPNDTSGTCDCDCCELPVPGDCNAYVLCINKVAFVMRCSPDLYFNPMTGTCDYKQNVACATDDFTCPERSGRYLLPGSCSYFIECHSGRKTIRKCPEGLQFNQSSEMCSWIGSCAGQQPDDDTSSKIVTDNSICKGCDYCFKPFAEDCSTYARCLQSVATEERCAAGLFFNPATEMCDHDYNVECPEPQPQPECPQTFGYFPYPGECGMYLQCVNGSAIVKNCPGILHFDPVKKHCDYPWAAGCSDSDSLPTPEPTQDLTQCDCDCCLKPVGTDCRSFVLCINGMGFERSCSSGLLFNPQTENCDFAENVYCPVTPEIPGYYCPEHQGLFPHPEDCHKFIHCAHGIPYVKDCPSDLHFNPKLKVCDWPYAAGCQDSQTTDPPDDDNVLPCDVCDSCFIPDEADCASYIYCRNGKGYKLRCAENLLYNPDTESCDIASNVKCPNQPSSECLKPEGIFAANDCSQFIQCSNGIAYMKDCPDGLLFNPLLLICDWPENVKCGEIPVQPTPSDDDSDTSNMTCTCDCCFLPYNKDCSKYILCLDGHAHIGQCSRGLLFNPSIQNCDLAERVKCGQEPPSCPEPNGLFPNQDQCSSYLRCTGGAAELQYCQNGTHFSTDMKQCTDPCKAKCYSSYDCSTTTEDVPPSPAPSVCLEPGGFYPVMNDCTSFYVCSNGRPERILCPYGLHYNAEYEVCEDPCDAQCDHTLGCVSTSGTSPKTTHSPTPPSSTPDPQCLQGDGLFPVKDDCSSFYQCSKGRGYRMKCPPGLHFSPKRRACAYPCDAKCNSSLDCSSTSTSPKTTTSTTPSTPDSHCLQGDGLYPAKNDCTSFYQCSGGRSYLMKCPAGLHFSYKHQVCEYPCVAKCNSSIDCSSTTPKPISTPSPHCPAKNGLFPVLGDCTAFYLCSNGKEYLIHCPPGLHYSEKHEICENPCVAQCNASLDCETTTKTALSSTTPHPISPECEEPDGLFPNPNDCGSFYQCSNGRSHLTHCPSGLHFSIDDSACEKPCVAGCDLDIDCPPEFPDPQGNCTCDSCYLPDPSDCSALYFCENGRLRKGYCPYGTLFSRRTLTCEDESTVECEANGDPIMCPERFGFYPYPGDCSKFVFCDNGLARIRECQKGLEYDPQTKVCSTPKGYCGDEIQDPNCPQPTGLFPDPTNCSLFYHCEHGVAYHKRCPPPLMFNPDQEVCDWPQNVACGRNATDASTSSVSPYYSTTSTSPSPSPTSPSCYEVPGVVCPCACRVPTYDECSSYFQCQEDGTACKKFCPEGLYFNKVEMVCDLPENVECRDFYYTSIRRAKRLGHLLGFSPTNSQ